MDPNNAAITFPAPKELDFCDNSLIWIMKKWHKLDEPPFFCISVSHEELDNFHRDTTLIKIGGKF